MNFLKTFHKTLYKLSVYIKYYKHKPTVLYKLTVCKLNFLAYILIKEEELLMSFGKYLKVKREEKNLSMNKLGELVGITAMYISQLESGKRNNPSIEVLHKLSKSLEVPNEELMEAAGYIGSRTMEVEDFIEELRETISQERENIETQSVPQEEQEQFKLDSLLDSNHQIFFQDRLLTKEEKTKIRSVIEIVLKD